MPLNISEFVNNFSNDLARPSRFEVYFTVPALLSLNYGGIVRDLTYTCETAELPSRTFGTADQKFGSNPTQKFPIHSSYNDLTLGFIIKDTMEQRTIFDVWMELINPTNTFDFNYKDDYKATINVVQYDLKNNPSYTTIIYNAYPIVVNQLDLDWSSDGHHKQTVVFAYDYWQLIGFSDGQNSTALTPAATIVDATGPKIMPTKVPQRDDNTNYEGYDVQQQIGNIGG
jgi:T4-like virus tail tube protein gp19